MDLPTHKPQLAHNVTRLAHLDLPGAGQVYVAGQYAYIGHIPNQSQLGTSIIDVADARNPRIVSQIFLEDPNSHSHKARVIGDIMIVNSERNMTAIGRKADELPKLRTQLRTALGREPNHAELAQKLGVQPSDIPAVEAAERNPYDQGGFRIYNVADRAHPKLITFQKTSGIGVHRFDMDANYAYISTEMPGYIGNVCAVDDSKTFGSLRCQVAAPGKNIHTKSLRSRNHFLCNLAESNQSQRAAKEPLCLTVFLLIPFTRSKLTHVVCDAPIKREY